jgi:hypothetical protein
MIRVSTLLIRRLIITTIIITSIRWLATEKRDQRKDAEKSACNDRPPVLRDQEDTHDREEDQCKQTTTWMNVNTTPIIARTPEADPPDTSVSKGARATWFVVMMMVMPASVVVASVTSTKTVAEATVVATTMPPASEAATTPVASM